MYVRAKSVSPNVCQLLLMLNILVYRVTSFCVVLSHVHSVPAASQAERMVMTVAEIVRQLIQAHEERRDVNLNK